MAQSLPIFAIFGSNSPGMLLRCVSWKERDVALPLGTSPVNFTGRIKPLLACCDVSILTCFMVPLETTWWAVGTTPRLYPFWGLVSTKFCHDH